MNDKGLNGLMEALSRAAAAEREDDVGGKSNPFSGGILPEAKIEMLKEFLERYTTPVGERFKVGDFVTPAPTSNLRGRGQPHVVLEISPSRGIAEAAFRAEMASHASFDCSTTEGPVATSGSAFGAKLDMRVASVAEAPNPTRGDGPTQIIACHWVDSAEFLPWTAP